MRIAVYRGARAASPSSGSGWNSLSSKNDNSKIHLGAANIYFYINCAHRQRPASSLRGNPLLGGGAQHFNVHWARWPTPAPPAPTPAARASTAIPPSPPSAVRAMDKWSSMSHQCRIVCLTSCSTLWQWQWITARTNSNYKPSAAVVRRIKASAGELKAIERLDLSHHLMAEPSKIGSESLSSDSGAVVVAISNWLLTGSGGPLANL